MYFENRITMQIDHVTSLIDNREIINKLKWLPFQLLQYVSFITHKYNKPLREKLFPYFIFCFSGKTRSLAT